ncbi:MAG: hypothetical protein LW832_00720, partial [Parachlamydia sp.]|nr:hypothetical protein [Parachlamydia sp.]
MNNATLIIQFTSPSIFVTIHHLAHLLRKRGEVINNFLYFLFTLTKHIANILGMKFSDNQKH